MIAFELQCMQEHEYILISVVPCGPAVGGSLSTQYTDRLLIKHIQITPVLHAAANKSILHENIC